MKKLSISLLIALMGLGFVSCSDDDDSSAGKNGDKCTQNSDCASNYCESGKCAPAKAADGSKCKVDSDCVSNLCLKETCVAQKNDKREEGQECESNDDCKSNKCDETTHKCVAAESEKKADGADCAAADECKSNKCEAGKCVAATTEPTKKADGETCTAHDECNSSICHQGKCGLPSTCSVSDEDYCAGNIYVHCDVDLTTGGEGEAEAAFEVKECEQTQACVVSGTNKGCFDTCTTADETKTECDPDSYTADGHDMTKLITYKCTSVDEKLLFVVDGEPKDCGPALCDQITNTCTGEATVGVKCEYDGQCKSSYCEKAADATQGVCADKKAADADCTRDSACQSGYCKESTHKCTARVENDAACDVNADCTSRYCKKTGDAAKGTCAVKPSGYEENGKACTDSANCLSGYCNGSVCADKPVIAKAGECSDTEKCEDANKICSKDYKCVDKVGDKGGNGDACTSDENCADGLKCHTSQNKCRLAQSVDSSTITCTGLSTKCEGNVLIKCEEDPYGGDDGGRGSTSYVASISACAAQGNVCATQNGKSECMAPCDKVGASYKECTGDNGALLTTYTCTEVNGVKVFVPTSIECPGIAGCNPTQNNSAKCN